MKVLPSNIEEMKVIKLTYGDINNPTFANAMEKIDGAVGVFSGKEMFDWNKVKTRWDKEHKRARKLFTDILQKHANLDENKRPKYLPSGKLDTKDEAAYEKDCEELMESSFEIKCYGFKTDSFAKASLAPKEIRACAKLLSDYPAEDLAGEEDEPKDGESTNVGTTTSQETVGE